MHKTSPSLRQLLARGFRVSTPLGINVAMQWVARDDTGATFHVVQDSSEFRDPGDEQGNGGWQIEQRAIDREEQTACCLDDADAPCHTAPHVDRVDVSIAHQVPATGDAEDSEERYDRQEQCQRGDPAARQDGYDAPARKQSRCRVSLHKKDIEQCAKSKDS